MRFRQVLRLACLALTAVSLCVCAGVSPALGATCGKGQVSTKSKPCTAPPTKSPPLAVTDPGDSGSRVSATDAITIIRFLGPVQDPNEFKYQLEIENTSGIGYINTFSWVPPSQMTITAITSSEGGHCRLVDNAIACTGGQKGIAPPSCTCLAGGSMSVNFTATGNEPTFDGHSWTHYGLVGSYTEITSMTPVPYHIPSVTSPSSNGEDLPLCAKGQTSTKSKPCSTQ